MAIFDLSPAKAVLLAVQLASKCDITTLRTLIFQHRKTLRNDLVLRILLSHLPESLEPTNYVPLLQDLVDESIEENEDLKLDQAVVADLEEIRGLDEPVASRKVRKLHLLPLLWLNAPADAPDDHLVQFLIHRSLRIDENTGLIAQLPGLLAPFLSRSTFLRTWMITTALPLLRLAYEYHPHNSPIISIPAFEVLSDEAGIALLLGSTGKSEEDVAKVGRDLKGLVGPWMYGDNRSKRRKLRKNSEFNSQGILPLQETPAINEQCASWEEVFKWITAQASTTWRTAVHAIEQWDGPGDVDLGGYEDATEWLTEDDQQHLERRYARSALAAAFLVPESSLDALAGIHRILARIVILLDLERIPTLEAAGALLTPVSDLGDLVSPENKAFLRSGHLEESNILTKPTDTSLRFLHAALISAYLFTKAGNPMTLRRAADLALQQNADQQRIELKNLISVHNNRGPKTDDRYWVRTRNEILWLQNWGTDELGEGLQLEHRRGILGQLSREEVEILILKTLLSNNRIILAQSIYQSSPVAPLSKQILHDTLIISAKDAFDNATNGNRTRGGVKRCSDIMQAFQTTLVGSQDANELEHLIKVTHELSDYKLVVKKQELFRPVFLRIHDDPISIISRILQQNPKSYLQINNMVSLGADMVKAGLTHRKHPDGKHSSGEEEQHEERDAEKRVVSFCIDAALAEDDFETAYSYVTTRLVTVADPAQMASRDGKNKNGMNNDSAPPVLDDWSWKAALETGKYKFNRENGPRDEVAFRNAEIHHLEQRKECLSHALRYAPASALTSILNAFRRCEEELETKLAEEEADEAAFDLQVDNQPNHLVPGGFNETPTKREPQSSRPAEEAPLSLFDLSRASMASAQKGISTLSLLRGGQKPTPKANQRPVSQGSMESISATESLEQRERKRDQLRNVAAGTLNAGAGALAGGLSWVLGAPPPRDAER